MRHSPERGRNLHCACVLVRFPTGTADLPFRFAVEARSCKEESRGVTRQKAGWRQSGDGSEESSDTASKGVTMYAKVLDTAYPTPESTEGAGSDADLIKLLTLREFEASSPLTGLDAINHVALTARMLGIAPPAYPLVHGLSDEGLLECLGDRPPRYRTTSAGSREAERLAEQCWPRLRDEVVRMGARLSPASPRTRPEIVFFSRRAQTTAPLGQ